MSTITIGTPLAKNEFSTCDVNPPERVLQRRDLRGDGCGVWLAPPDQVDQSQTQFDRQTSAERGFRQTGRANLLICNAWIPCSLHTVNQRCPGCGVAATVPKASEKPETAQSLIAQATSKPQACQGALQPPPGQRQESRHYQERYVVIRLPVVDRIGSERRRRTHAGISFARTWLAFDIVDRLVWSSWRLTLEISRRRGRSAALTCQRALVLSTYYDGCPLAHTSQVAQVRQSCEASDGIPATDRNCAGRLGV